QTGPFDQQTKTQSSASVSAAIIEIISAEISATVSASSIFRLDPRRALGNRDGNDAPTWGGVFPGINRI
ncbi:hypothetical protein GWI33_022606, partial [Rhynchophorus ferrugineus]